MSKEHDPRIPQPWTPYVENLGRTATEEEMEDAIERAKAEMRPSTELIAALAAYDFRDPHGHPLTGCKEWGELVRMVKGEDE